MYRGEEVTLEEQFKMLLIDNVETDTAIRDMCREVLTDKQIDGDSLGVPTLEDIVEMLITGKRTISNGGWYL